MTKGRCSSAAPPEKKMASMADKALRKSFDTNFLGFHGDTITVLSGANAGRVYKGSIEAQSAVLLDSEGGSDAREKCVVSFSRAHWPTELQSQDGIEDGDGQKWIVVGRENNPAGTSVDFHIVKVVEGVDKP